MKSYSLSFSAKAKNDLHKIYLHIAERDVSTARKFLNDLNLKLEEAARNGITGSPRDWVSPNLRCIVFKKRIIYIRIIKDTILVVRVLHEKQDYSASDFIV